MRQSQIEFKGAFRNCILIKKKLETRKFGKNPKEFWKQVQSKICKNAKSNNVYVNDNSDNKM